MKPKRLMKTLTLKPVFSLEIYMSEKMLKEALLSSVPN